MFLTGHVPVGSPSPSSTRFPKLHTSFSVKKGFIISLHTVYVGSYEPFITAPFLFDLHFAYANTDSEDIHTATIGEVKMNGFFQMLKK